MSRLTITSLARGVPAFVILHLLAAVGIGAESKAHKSTSAVAEKKSLPAACTVCRKGVLEIMVGWELRDGKPKDVSPGMSQCDFTVPPKAYQTRFYTQELPEAAGFSSIVITSFPTTPETFAESRRTMGTETVEVSYPNDGAFLSGPAMIFVRVGNRGISMRLHVETPKTEAGRAKLREVVLNLAREGAHGTGLLNEMELSGKAK